MASSLKKFQSQTEHKTSYNLSRSTEKKKIPLYTSGEATAWKRPTPKSNWRWANAMENTKKMCVKIARNIYTRSQYRCAWHRLLLMMMMLLPPLLSSLQKPSKEEFFTWISSFSTVKFQSTTDARTVNKLTGNKQETTKHFYFFVVHFIFRHKKKKKKIKIHSMDVEIFASSQFKSNTFLSV